MNYNLLYFIFYIFLTLGVYRILHDLYIEKYSDEMSLLVEEIADDIRDFNKKIVKTSKSDHGINKTQGRTNARGSVGGIIIRVQNFFLIF